MKMTLALITVLVFAFSTAITSAEEFGDENDIFTYKWTYSGGVDSGKLQYSITNNTDIPIVPLSGDIRFDCKDGKSVENSTYIEPENGHIAPGESAELTIDYFFDDQNLAGSVRPPCMYNGGVANIEMVKEPSARQKDIRWSNVQCGSRQVVSLVSLEPEKNLFKIYTSDTVHSINWKNLRSKNLSREDGQDYIAELICGGSADLDSTQGVIRSIYQFMEGWGNMCTFVTKECVDRYYRTVAVGVRG